MIPAGYVLAELDDSDDPNLYGGLPFADIHKAEQCVREVVADDPRVEPVIVPVGAPLTHERIAALKAGHPDDREAEALRAATQAFWRFDATEPDDDVDAMRRAITAYRIAHEHPELDTLGVLQALDATTESETR